MKRNRIPQALLVALLGTVAIVGCKTKEEAAPAEGQNRDRSRGPLLSSGGKALPRSRGPGQSSFSPRCAIW